MPLYKLKETTGDVDPGIDDAYALAIIVTAHKLGILQIVAVLCSAGNTFRQQSCINLERILKSLNATDVLIFEGSYRPILREQDFSNAYGADGFGDVFKPFKHRMRIRTTEDFCHYVETSFRPKSLTILVFAPMTLTAGFLLHNTNKLVKEIWVMGGNDLDSSITEWSFQRDPEAVASVFVNSQVPVTMVPLATAQSIYIKMEFREKVLAKIKMPFIKLMNTAERNIVNDRSEWLMNDVIMAAAYAFPEVVKKYEWASVIVNTSYPTNAQSGVLIHSNINPKNVRIITKVNSKLYLERLIESLTQCDYIDSSRLGPPPKLS